MVCREITDRKIWEDFLLRCEEKTFLQAWNWGEFQQRMGNKIWRLGTYEDVHPAGVHGVVLAVKVKAKRGTFLMVQHSVGISEVLLDELKAIARQENCSFIRIAPLLLRTSENKKLFKDLGFRESPMHASAYEATWKLNIMPSEEELLADMRKTTRYLIRQAEHNPEIEIINSSKTEDAETYQKLNEKTAKHQKFTPFSLNFVKNEFEIFAKDNESLLFFGRYKGEVIASALVIFWSGIGFYHQAALDPKYHKIPVAYLLQWEIIKEAKRRGCRLYDFWGYTDPKAQPKHPWAGPTLFKMGFGGRAYEYVKTQDLPLSKKYWLTYFFESLRKTKRGL
ncbi:MAG: hypothetical protein A2896_02015 [Candidatus Nealsonbacteria bacterium RIFCSPLOWO2_01_FULL_43_32]|uniref:N-acetyltransferase domain-containing protein n=1 Tax=Candidatus Nealsonbacteria bacterium RIFCSPLOWO2_01_FULL_43_32 TaxID=1801672 RepID=A0A1G2EFV7_9BACT|nr:MAG: hypothetical protein A2896_02015 [Candidatus Nealsonbacteria bacterium RIFCSPLOWO2_01_FULL_43_32]